MGQKTISQLPVATSVSNTDLLIVQQGGITKSTQASLLRSISATSVTEQVITASAGQTVFVSTNAYTPGTNNIFVYRNGLKLISGTDFTETNSNTVTLTQGADAGDQIVLDVGTTVAGNFQAANVAFKQDGTGAVSTNVAAKLEQVVSVKDFGAAGDGITDDTAAIQAAVNSGAGGVVFFPEGIYLISDAISVPANTHLQGTGVGSVIKSLTLVNGGSGFGCRQLDIRAVAGVRVSDIKFDGGSLTGLTAGMRSILCYEATDYIIQDCVFVTPGAAVASVNCSRYSILNNDVFIQSTTGVAVHDGIIDQWWGSNNFQIRGNRVRGNGIGRYGILATATTTQDAPAPVYNYVISENHVFSCINAGIWAMGRSGLTYNFQITDNIVDTVNDFGACVTDAYNFVVKGNVIRNTGFCAIRVFAESSFGGTYGARYGVISENIFQNANTLASTDIEPGSAISIFSTCEYIELTNNVVRGSTHRYAVYLGQSTSNIDVKGECYIAGLSGDIINLATLASTNKLPGANLYTPTLTAVANVSSSNAYANTMYRRTGNIVQVFGRVEVTPTAAADTATQLAISLPIPSNLAFTTDAVGTASTSFGITGGIYADFTNDRVTLQFPSQNTVANYFSFQFQYIIK